MSIIYPTLIDSTKSLPLYLTSIGVFFEEVKIARPQGYPDYQWIQTISGEGELLIGSTKYTIDPSVGIFIPKHIPHSYVKTSPHWITHWVAFNGPNLTSFFDSLGMNEILLINTFDSYTTTALIDSTFQKASGNYNKEAFSISTKLYQLIEHLYSTQHVSLSHIHPQNEQLNHLLDYIDQYYMMDLSLQELSNFIHVSPQYLCRLFKTQLNLRPFEYINQVRINKSKTFLSDIPTPSILQVSEAVGFHNPSYFTAIFKQNEKITPRKFVQLHQRGV